MKSILEASGYTKSAASGVWTQLDYAGIAYNDGDEVEERIANIIDSVSDRSVLSEELKHHITDWPSLYHLSSSRANLLRPFSQKLNGAKVLEIGAGCGAITRYLGECHAQVLALEGSVRRAAIASSRTRDLPNVEVLAEQFDTFQCDEQFDVVTLIGVLEYANKFVSGETPALAMLAQARKFLKPDGLLILAIENQFGLKYWAGAPEDHIGQPMYGVEGRYQSNEPQTYGHRVLKSLLGAAGFVWSDFFAPMPDYKVPLSIVTPSGFECIGFDAAAFAEQSVHRDPQLPSQLTFSPELAWRDIVKNGLGIDLANSFLVAASLVSKPALDSGILAYHFSTGRSRGYCKQTIFRTNEGGEIGVHCELLAPNDRRKATEALRHELTRSSKYVQGRTLGSDFVSIVSKDNWTISQVGEFLKRYIWVVFKIGGVDPHKPVVRAVDRLIPGECFDLVPQNIIQDIAGDCHPIDREWALRSDMPIGWLLCRALQLLVRDVTRFGRTVEEYEKTHLGFFLEAFKAAGLDVEAATLLSFAEMERALQACVAQVHVDQIGKWPASAPLPMAAFIHTSSVQSEQFRQELAETREELGRCKEAMHVLSEAVSQKEALLLSSQAELTQSHEAQAILSQTISEYAADIVAHRNSVSWRITYPLRVIATPVVLMLKKLDAVRGVFRRNGGLKSALLTALVLWRREGFSTLLRTSINAFYPAMRHQDSSAFSAVGNDEKHDRNDYTEWVRRYDTLTDADRQGMQEVQSAFGLRPLVSVVMPTYNPKPEWLIEAIESVRNQIYTNWELCIADDASTNPKIRPILEGYAALDQRIKVAFRKVNGHISAASNTALALVTGQWVALLDHDDLLSEHALFWVVDAINRHPEVRLVYSDEDKITESGQRFAPYFKCDWNPDLFYSHNMISHLGVYHADIAKEIGGFREGFEGSQDYDLALRYIERVESKQICHVPRVLYHWRVHKESTAMSGGAKPYAVVAGEKALNDHFSRTGVCGRVADVGYGYMPAYELPSSPPLVSIIIPTRNGKDLLKQCVDSIFAKTTYKNYEILIVDNGSDDVGALEYFQQLASRPNVRVIRDDSPFNYSRLNNNAVEVAAGKVVALVNNDIEVISPDWLSVLVAHAIRPGIGAVGAKLWYTNKTLQHGGVFLGYGGVAGHSHKHSSEGHFGYFARLRLTQALSAVTAACLVIRKDIYKEVGGLEEENLQVAFNDIDFCLRVREAGYRNIWTPQAELYHHESATRGHEDTPEKRFRFNREVAYMKQRWGEQLLNDPAYSPNLTLDHEDFSYAWPPRLRKSF